MKYVFSTTLVLLLIASTATWLSLPEQRSDVPVIYWVTDNNPARKEQIEIFHRWLKKSPNRPRMLLKLDVANRRTQKMIIQGVSGVAGDVMDLWSGQTLQYFHAIGLLQDVTEWARELGFDPGRTYPAMEPEITLNGRQYMFPCNVAVYILWVNKATFRRYGLAPPPKQWEIGTFERMCKEFVKRANPESTRLRRFFLSYISLQILFRSFGLSVFNETLTRCILDDPRYVKALKLKYKWTYKDRIIPSRADIESFSTESGYGGSTFQLFNSGFYAMFGMGRYALIQLRKFGKLDLAISFPPYGDFPNTITGTRAAGIYAGSKHKHLAKYSS